MFESQGVKDFEGKMFGPYRAYVSNNKDPKKLGRIKVICPSVYGDNIESKWAYPMFDMAGKNFGSYKVPPIKTSEGGKVYVWIFLEMGDPNYPVWIGGAYGETNGISNLHNKFKKTPKGVDRKEPNVYGFITPNGHCIEFDDDVGSSAIRITSKEGHVIQVGQESNGIKLTSKEGSSITINQNIVINAVGKLYLNGQEIRMFEVGV